VALFLYIVASFVVGVLVGWLVLARILAGRQETAPASTVTAPPATLAATVVPKPAPVAEPAAEPEAAAEPVTEPEPVAEVVAEPVTETEPVVEAEAEPVAEVVAEPVAETEPEAEEKAEPAAEAVVEPAAAVEPATEPAIEPAAETTAEPEPVAETTPEPVAEAEPEPATEPVAVATLPAAPDNLLRIEGIGPKAAGALNAAGITTYEQLAASDEAALRAAIAAAGMRATASLTSWPSKARALADGASPANQNGRLVSDRTAG